MTDIWDDPRIWGNSDTPDKSSLWSDPKIWGSHVATKEDVSAQQQEDAQAVPDESKFGHIGDYISDAASRGIASLPGVVADVAKDVGEGAWNLAKGGLHGDVSTMMVPQHFPGFDTGSQKVQKAVEQQLGPPIQPQNTAEKYLGALVGGGAAGLASLNPEGVLAGAMSGAGGQAGSDLVPGSEWAPFLGSLIAPSLSHTGLHALIRHLEGGGTIEHPLVSPKGAVGPMQVMSGTAADPGLGVKPWDGTPKDRVRLGNDYADALDKHYGGDETKVLAAYNAGFGHVDHLIEKFGDNWKDHLPEETVNYLAHAGLLHNENPGSTGKAVPPLDPELIAKVMGDDQKSSNVLTLAEQQDMDASVPKIVPPTAVDARSIGQGADLPEQTPANDDLHNLPPATVENAEQGYNDWLDHVIASQGPQKSARDIVSKDDYHPFNPDTFDAIKQAAESGNKGAEETLANQYGVTIRQPLAALGPEYIAVGNTEGTEPPQEPPSGGGNDGNGGAEEPPSGPEMSPEDKLIQAINEVRPVTIEQKTLLHNLRVNQNRKLAEIQARNGSVGEMKAALKGGLPTAEFEPLDHGLSPEEEGSLRRQINSQRGLGTFDKLHAHEALDKLLDPTGMKRLTEGEIDTLTGIFDPELIKAIRERVSPSGDPGLFNKIWNTVNAAKTIGDWSDLTKSNATMFLTPGYWKSVGNFVRGGFFREGSYQRIRAITRSHPDYDLVRQMKISHTGQGEAPGQHEEIFKQNLLEHVPVLSTVMKSSERVYSGVANEVRDAAALKMIARDRRAGLDVTNPIYLKNAGELINTLTGRASFGRSRPGVWAEKAMPFLSKVLWTPRQYASWVKTAAYAINPKWWYNASPAMRLQLASGVLSLTGWTVGNLAIASSLGYEVHKNILDPLFGKYKIGDTLYDASAGRGSTLHTIATAASGYILKDNNLESLGDNPHANLKTRGDVVMHWMRTHASPAAGLIENEFMGKDLAHPVNAVGHTEDWTSWKSRTDNPLYQAATPMAAEGTLDAASHYGWKNKQTYLTGAGEMLGRQANTIEERPAKNSLWSDSAMWGNAKETKSDIWKDSDLWSKK